MTTTPTKRSLAIAGAALLTAMSCATAAHADQATDNGKHLGQAKKAAATSQPTAASSPTATPSSQPTATASASAKKPHPTHPAHPATGKGSSNGKAKGQGNGGGNGGGAPSKAPGVTPGNNGTVKIAEVGDIDRIPNNTPHPGCRFEVQWYGFDAGSDVVSTVAFTPQAPTKDVSIAVDGPSSVPVGEDAASGAGTSTGLDAIQDYTLSFSGEAPAKQGYHVRLTVATPHSQGNDTKTKVFWVAPCDTTSATPAASPAPIAATTPAAPAQGSVGDTGRTPQAAQATPEAETVPAAVQATPAPAGTTANGAAVPTAIEAGQARHGVAAWVRSPLPLVIVGLGVLLGALGVARLRRRA